MKEVPLSNCEKEFILQAISERKRLDDREIYEYRQLQIIFGIDRGCCQVTLGNTRVLAQVSCEVTAPKQARPSEGVLFINVELSPMAAPQFEPGRQSDEGVELNRLLERCLKESRCVDTESLCILSGLKVWQIRCDLHVLNHDGNMLDCASVAAMAALAHFKRPDVTITGEEVTIHTIEDKDPIPLSVHHMPLCVTFAFYHQGKFLLVDPSDREEQVMEGKLVIGMNKHREVCALQMTGSMLLLKDQVLRCSNIAVTKVTEMTNLIQEALENDTKARAKGEKFGFASSIIATKVTAHRSEETSISLASIEEQAKAIVLDSDEEIEDDILSDDVEMIENPNGKSVGVGGANTWLDEGEEDDRMEELIQEKQGATHKKKQPEVVAIELSDDSEEEETITLDADDLQVKKSKKSPSKEPAVDLTKALKSGKKKKVPTATLR